VPGAGADKRVIESGAEVDEDQSAAKNGATDDLPCRATGGLHDEIGRASDCDRCADTMRDGVGEDVS